MLLRRQLMLACALAVLLACGRSAEHKLVGEWTVRGEAGSRIVYRSDHTFAASLPTVVGAVFSPRGTWRIEGDQIVTTLENGESKDTIVLLTDHMLKFKTARGGVLECERIK